MPGYIHDSRTPEEKRRERQLFFLNFLLIAPLVFMATMMLTVDEFRQQGQDIANAEWQEAVAPLIEEQRGKVFVRQGELEPADLIEVRDMYLSYESAERERFDRDCKVTDWRERVKWQRPECQDYARAHQLIL
ncbi:MAG: hypothetical protein ABIG32_02445 [Candidatus Uhrbacteria bacterium]|nr:hypothetical protein [Patescibacteria group bacterium]MBU1907464.1 hypothetical protein [Patescibacteria group bacterium]